MAGLREENKARRRTAILDALIEILRSHDLKDLTTEQLAARAGVSHATVFNLIGTREQLLQALVDRVLFGIVDSLVALDARTEGDPIAAARLVIDFSVSAFTSEPKAFRAVISTLGWAERTTGLPAFDPAQLQVAAVREAQTRGIISKEFDAEGLGRQIYLSFLGATNAWARGVLSDTGYRTSAEHGLIAVLAATATDRYVGDFRKELRSLSQKLGRAVQPRPE